MKAKTKGIDLLLLIVSAWAVVATSQSGDYLPMHMNQRGYFSLHSSCEGIVNPEAEILVTPSIDGTYNFAHAQDFGFPSELGRQISIASSGEEKSSVLSVDGENRSCQAKLSGELFDTAGTIPFLCYDNASEELSCVITLKLLYLEEYSGPTMKAETAAPQSP